MTLEEVQNDIYLFINRIDVPQKKGPAQSYAYGDNKYVAVCPAEDGGFIKKEAKPRKVYKSPIQALDAYVNALNSYLDTVKDLEIIIWRRNPIIEHVHNWNEEEKQRNADFFERDIEWLDETFPSGYSVYSRLWAGKKQTFNKEK